MDPTAQQCPLHRGNLHAVMEGWRWVKWELLHQTRPDLAAAMAFPAHSTGPLGAAPVVLLQSQVCLQQRRSWDLLNKISDLRISWTSWVCCGSAGLGSFTSEASYYQEPPTADRDAGPSMRCPARLCHKGAAKSTGLLLHLPLHPPLYLCREHQSLLFIVGNSAQQFPKLPRISAIWGRTIEATALSALFLMPLLWMCACNPTEGSGLAACVVIINDKFAQNKCLAVVILYVFLRDAVWCLRGWGWGVGEHHVARSKALGFL